MEVSIHAPVKVRLIFSKRALATYGFNSRTCEGATNDVGFTCGTDEVSIHAPVKVRPGAYDGP